VSKEMREFQSPNGMGVPVTNAKEQKKNNNDRERKQGHHYRCRFLSAWEICKGGKQGMGGPGEDLDRKFRGATRASNRKTRQQRRSITWSCGGHHQTRSRRQALFRRKNGEFENKRKRPVEGNQEGSTCREFSRKRRDLVAAKRPDATHRQRCEGYWE